MEIKKFKVRVQTFTIVEFCLDEETAKIIGEDGIKSMAELRVKNSHENTSYNSEIISGNLYPLESAANGNH